MKDFNFNWMTNYIYADDAAPVFPKGTIIKVSAYYDNTKANKSNPDPDQWVGYGDRTVDEMAHAWMNVYYLTDAEYQDYVAKHGEGVTNGVQAAGPDPAAAVSTSAPRGRRSSWPSSAVRPDCSHPVGGAPSTPQERVLR